MRKRQKKDNRQQKTTLPHEIWANEWERNEWERARCEPYLFKCMRQCTIKCWKTSKAHRNKWSLAVSKQANIIDRHTSSCMIESKAGEWDMYCPPLDRAILIISKPIFCARRVRNCTLVLDMDVVSVNKSSWCLTVGGKNRGQTFSYCMVEETQKTEPDEQ